MGFVSPFDGFKLVILMRKPHFEFGLYIVQVTMIHFQLKK